MHQCWTRSTRTTRIKLRIGSDIYKGWFNVHRLKGEFVSTYGFKMVLGLVNKEESRFVWGGTRQAMVKVFTRLQYFESRGCSLFISLFIIITMQTQIKVDWALPYTLLFNQYNINISQYNSLLFSI